MMFTRILELERRVKDANQEFNELGMMEPAEYLYFDLNMHVKRAQVLVILTDWESYSKDQLQEFKSQYEQLLGKFT